MADDRGPQLEAVLITLLILSVITTVLRCYTMGFILKRFYTEDWLAVLTLVRYDYRISNHSGQSLANNGLGPILRLYGLRAPGSPLRYWKTHCRCSTG
jgi:hypothetical protein